MVGLRQGLVVLSPPGPASCTCPRVVAQRGPVLGFYTDLTILKLGAIFFNMGTLVIILHRTGPSDATSPDPALTAHRNL